VETEIEEGIEAMTEEIEIETEIGIDIDVEGLAALPILLIA
jgi:hypothetical protein